MKNKRGKKKISCGDIFRIGGHVLACGDARDAELVTRVLGGRKVSAIVTDPPYGVKVVESKEGFSKLKVSKKILNDDISSETEYAEFTKDWLKAVAPHLERRNSIHIFNGDTMLFALREGMLAAGVKFSQLLVWIKSQPVIGRKDYLPQHELIAYGWRGTHEFRKTKDKSVIFCPKPSRSAIHPTQKPVSLVRRLVMNSAGIGATVYDCFAGSGTTAVACEQAKRKAVLIERDEEYCQAIIDRMEKQFNLKSQKIHG